MPPGDDDRPHEADRAVAHLARLTVRDQSTTTLLQTVVDLTKHVLPGEVEASISLVVEGRPATTAFTGALARDLDLGQYSRNDGPCLHAARTGELTEIRDARVDDRWPDHAREAVALGSLSSLSVPLPTSAQRGSLNVYARTIDAFDDDSRSAATRFAPFAAVAINTLDAYQSARTMADDLETALQSRSIIEQAKGILIERHKLTSDQAFQVLAQASMHSNTKLRDVAEHLVRTGELTR